MDIFRFASGFAAHKKSLEFDKKEKLKELEAQKEGRLYIPKLSPYTKTSEMTNTKIYCLETNKLLAEFDYDFNNLEKKDKSFLEEVAEISKGFKFYKAE